MIKKTKSKFKIGSLALPNPIIILVAVLAVIGLTGYLVLFATKTVTIQTVNEEGITEYTKIKVPLFQRTAPLTAEAAPTSWSVAVLAPSNIYDRDIKAKMNSVVSEFNRISGGKFTVSYQLFYTNNQVLCENSALSSNLKQQIGFSSRNTIIYWMPGHCPPDAAGQPIGTEDGNTNGNIWSATVYSASVATTSILHEIGHYALTLPHAEDYCVNGQPSANRYTCAVPATATATVNGLSVKQLQSNLKPLVKGDGFDYMGNCGVMGTCNFNAAFRAKIGWITNVKTLPTTANTATTVSLASTSPQSSGAPQLLNIFDYHLEYTDSRLDIRKKCTSSKAVYNSPTETTCYITSLTANQIFYDSSKNLWVKLESASSGSANVFVGINKNPTSNTTTPPSTTPVGGNGGSTGGGTSVPPSQIPPSTPPTKIASLLGRASIPTTSQFTVGPITVRKNIPVILSWVCADSDRAKLVNDSLTQVGSTDVTGTFNTKAFNNTGTKIYQLSCYKNNQKIDSRSLTIYVTE